MISLTITMWVVTVIITKLAMMILGLCRFIPLEKTALDSLHLFHVPTVIGRWSIIVHHHRWFSFSATTVSWIVRFYNAFFWFFFQWWLKVKTVQIWFGGWNEFLINLTYLDVLHGIHRIDDEYWEDWWFKGLMMVGLFSLICLLRLYSFESWMIRRC